MTCRAYTQPGACADCQHKVAAFNGALAAGRAAENPPYHEGCRCYVAGPGVTPGDPFGVAPSNAETVAVLVALAAGIACSALSLGAAIGQGIPVTAVVFGYIGVASQVVGLCGLTIGVPWLRRR